MSIATSGSAGAAWTRIRTGIGDGDRERGSGTGIAENSVTAMPFALDKPGPTCYIARLPAVDGPFGAPAPSWGRIAQLVEQLTLNQRVQGSSPCAPTNQNKGLGRIGLTPFLILGSLGNISGNNHHSGSRASSASPFGRPSRCRSKNTTAPAPANATKSICTTRRPRSM